MNRHGAAVAGSDPTMHFRLIDGSGAERTLKSEEDFLKAVAVGEVGDNSLIFDSTADRWRRATDVASYRVAAAAARGHAAPKGEPEVGPKPGATAANEACPECAAGVATDAAFCSRCGTRLLGEDEQLWQYQIDGHEAGPVTKSALVSMVKAGEVSNAVRIKNSDMIYWVPAASHPAFKSDLTRTQLESAPTSRPLPESSQRSGRASGQAAVPTPPSEAGQHGWQGSLFYVLHYIGGGLFGLIAVILLVAGIGGGEPAEAAGVFALVGLFAAANIAVGWGVQKFRRWGWWVALILSYAALLGALAGLFTAGSGAAALGNFAAGVLYAVFVAYFHRNKFGSDPRSGGRNAPTGVLRSKSNARRVTPNTKWDAGVGPWIE